ncbi:hypothetical protein GCM10028807_08230 [Spirosoma daeguense]
MNLKILTILTVVVVSGCGKQQSTTEKSTTTPTAPVESSTLAAETDSQQQECYGWMTEQGDTIQLSLSRQGASVSGALLISYAGKDRRIGTFQGQMHGDTLIADHSYMQEGIDAVGEVAFLAKDGSFLEGLGPSEFKNKKEVFSPLSELTFTGEVLKRIPCNTISPSMKSGDK